MVFLNKKKRSYYFGWLAEFCVYIFFLSQGYRCIAWRKATPVGEIDFIVKRKTQLIFVEVKYRKTYPHDDPISYHQKQRIVRAAKYFLSGHQDLIEYDMRFDAFIFTLNTFPKHIKNAWF